MKASGLQELILSHHTQFKTPPTRHPVSRTINGIFGTSALDIIQTGYSPFVGFTDHQLSWIDIRWDAISGNKTSYCEKTTMW